MLTIPRSQFHRFLSVARRAGLVRRAAGFGQRLLIVAEPDRVVLTAFSHSVAVDLTIAGQFRPERFEIPLEPLSVSRGRSTDVMTLRRISEDRVALQWTDDQIPRVVEYDTKSSSASPKLPDRPETLAANDPELWTAFRDAVAIAADERTRFAIDCLQLRGGSGQIVASDSRHLLVQSGFTFPWPGEVLIPASLVLGCSELSGEESVSIGRSDDWLGIAAGPWTVTLRIEKDSRYPRVDDVIPTAKAETPRIELSVEDAEFLAAALPRLPVGDGEEDVVTVELNDQVAIRSKGAAHSQVTELAFTNSRAVGDPLTCRTKPEFLVRAARFGFRQICFFDRDGRVLCTDGRRQYVWVHLGGSEAIPSEPDAVRITSPVVRTTPQPEAKRARRFHSVSATNGQAKADCQAGERRRATRSRGKGSAIEQIGALRDSLKTAVVQANDVIRSLKQQRREAKIVRSTLESLRQLQKVAS